MGLGQVIVGTSVLVPLYSVSLGDVSQDSFGCKLPEIPVRAESKGRNYWLPYRKSPGL